MFPPQPRISFPCQTIVMAVLIGTAFVSIGKSQTSITRRQPVLFFCVINQGMFGALMVINSFPQASEAPSMPTLATVRTRFMYVEGGAIPVRREPGRARTQPTSPTPLSGDERWFRGGRARGTYEARARSHVGPPQYLRLSPPPSPQERMLTLRERAAGTYEASAYFLAKTTADTIPIVAYPILFSIILYVREGGGLREGRARASHFNFPLDGPPLMPDPSPIII